MVFYPLSLHDALPIFMAIMVGNGAQAGSLSPIAPTGLIVSGFMTKIGLGGHELWTYGANFTAHALVAVDRKSTRLNSSHLVISYAVFCLKKKSHVTDN